MQGILAVCEMGSAPHCRSVSSKPESMVLGTLDASFSPKLLVRAGTALAELTKLETLLIESLGTSLWSRAGVMLMACELLVISSLSSCPDPWEHRAVD